MENKNEKLFRAINLAGGPKVIVARLGLKSSMAVSQWKARGLPLERVIDLSRLTSWQITPHELSPKHYPHPNDGLPEALRNKAA